MVHSVSKNLTENLLVKNSDTSNYTFFLSGQEVLKGLVDIFNY